MLNLKHFFTTHILTALLLFAYVYFFLSPSLALASDPIGSWTTSSENLPNSISSHGAVAKEDNILILGGANTDDYSEVFLSGVNNNGSLAGWQSTASLPDTRYWLSIAKKNDRIYALGGARFDGGQSFVNTAYSAELESDGTIANWQTFTALPGARALGRAVVVGNRIYYAGGFNNSGAQDEVYYATINPDGTLGAWSLAGLLPETLFGFGMVEYQNNIIVIGGYNGSILRDKVYKASVNPDGSISAFTQTSTLPAQVYRGAIIRVGSIIISAGGQSNAGFLNKVYYSEINSDGTVNPWQESSNSLPQAFNGAAVAYANGFLYVTGGFNGAYLNTVYYSPLNFSDEINLAVPLLKQSNPSWGSQIYDSANIWSPLSADISNWGCALTSATMIFQYHKITKLPDDSNLDPGTLNSWLKSQPDGYIRNGLVNWLALSRLSRIAKPNNPSFSHDALEYKRKHGENKPQLTLDLQNGIPGILEQPGHFVVAKGKNLDTFNINDPFYNRTSLDDGYSNTFLSLGRFIPSNTDLSYVMLVVNEALNIVLEDSSNNFLGETFTQAPLNNDTDPGTSGEALKILYLPQPIGGNYSINLSSPILQNYKIEVYLYGEDGKVKIATFSGIVGPGDTDSYSIEFNKENSNNSSSSENITFDSFIADINSLYSLGEVNFPNRVLLLAQAKVAKKLSENNITKKASINILEAMQKEITKQKGKGISENAFNILNNDIQSLVSSLSN